VEKYGNPWATEGESIYNLLSVDVCNLIDRITIFSEAVESGTETKL